MITVILFCCCKNVFTLMNIWMVGKKLMKHHYLKKEDFESHLNMEDNTDADYAVVNRVYK